MFGDNKYFKVIDEELYYIEEENNVDKISAAIILKYILIYTNNTE